MAQIAFRSTLLSAPSGALGYYQASYYPGPHGCLVFVDEHLRPVEAWIARGYGRACAAVERLPVELASKRRNHCVRSVATGAAIDTSQTVADFGDEFVEVQ